MPSNAYTLSLEPLPELYVDICPLPDNTAVLLLPLRSGHTLFKIS